ncbi:AAWKG family protein [Streptomyces sp. NPDC088400]|uniref:AAWKG family protein n=1 Tax=Streptomyces sp. NPDC088400 TaxID=3365861 RepID=UPI00380C53F2
MALDPSKITSALDGTNDKWAEAISFFTGFKAPPRADLFDTLVGNEGIPQMKVEISDVGYVDYVDTEDLNWLYENAGYDINNTDFVIPFYSTSGGAGSDVTMHKARITLLGQKSVDGPPTGGYYEGGTFSSSIDGHLGMDGKPTWDTTKLTQYAYGTGLALEKLRNDEKLGTHGFAWNGLPVADADSVSLGTFDVVAGSFDRVAEFFVKQQAIVEEWAGRLGTEKNEAWRGQAAGVFWDLLNKINKQYTDYKEDTSPNGSYQSKQGNEIRQAKKDLQKAVIDLHNVWMDWELKMGNPLRWLSDLLTDVMNYTWDHNITKITYEIEGAGYSYYTNYIAEEGFDNRAKAQRDTLMDFGDLKDLSTWEAIGNKSIEMWQQSVKDNLEAAAIDAMEYVKNAWSNSSFDLGTVKSRGGDTLKEGLAEDKADKLEDDNKKKEDDAKKAAEEAQKKQDEFIAWQKEQARIAKEEAAKEKAEAEAKAAAAEAKAEKEKEEAKAEREKEKAEAEAKAAAAEAKADAKAAEAEAKQEQKEKEQEEKAAEAEAKAAAKEAEQEAKAEAKEAEQEAKQEEKEKEQEAKQAEQEAKQEQKEKEQEAKQAEQQAKQEAKQEEAERKQEEAQGRQEQMQMLQMNQAKAQQEEAKKEQAKKEAEQEAKQAEQEAEQEAKQAEQEAKQEEKEKEAEQKQAEQEKKQEAKEAEQEAKQEEKEKEAEQKQAEQEAKADRIRTEQEDKQEQLQAEQEQKQAEQEAKQEEKEKEAEQKQAEQEAKAEARQNEAEAKQDQLQQEQEKKQNEAEAKQDQLQQEQEKKQNEAQAKQEQLQQEAEKKQNEAEARFGDQSRGLLNGGDLLSPDISGPVNEGNLPVSDVLDVPGGGESHIDDNGRLVTEYPDGSSTTIDPLTHSSTLTRPDGTTVSGPLNTGDLLPNPDGSTTRLDPQGNVVMEYPDGTSQTIDPDTGSTTITNPDGTTRSGYLNDLDNPLNGYQPPTSGPLNSGSLDGYNSPSYDLSGYEEELFDENPYESPLDSNAAAASSGSSAPNHNRTQLNSGPLPGFGGGGADAMGSSSGGTGTGSGGMPMGGGMGGGMGGMGGGMGGAGGGQDSKAERVRSVIDGDVVSNRRPQPGARPPLPGSRGYADDEVRVAASGNTAGQNPFLPPMAGGGAPNQTQTQSGDRARDSWVPEDEDVWGTDEGGAPAVIGR